jgi:molybdopterin synthase sulfur carrier subunit
MAVEVRVPAILQPVVGGQKVLRVEGGTVGEILDRLDQEFPGVKKLLLDENGEIRRHINIYLNDEDIRFLQRLETPARDGDVVSILPALAGGGEDAV